MSQTREDQAQPKVSRESLSKSEINFLTQMVFILNKHASEKVCRHTVKMIAEEVRIMEDVKL
jgi:hypothetical protein